MSGTARAGVLGGAFDMSGEADGALGKRALTVKRNAAMRYEILAPGGIFISGTSTLREALARRWRSMVRQTMAYDALSAIDDRGPLGHHPPGSRASSAPRPWRMPPGRS